MDETRPATIEGVMLKLDKIERQLSKTINLQTRISKALHLLPVTEKEERSIQIAQRTNLALAAKVNDDLNKVMADRIEEVPEDDINPYDGILGNDFAGGQSE